MAPCAMGWLVLIALPTAHAWPDPPQWRPFAVQGVPVEDPVDPEVPGARDLVGDSSAPVASWWADDEALWLRVRVDASPVQPDGGWSDGVWGVQIERTGDGVSDVLILADGTGALRGWADVGGLGGVSPPFTTWGPAVDLGHRSSGDVRAVGAGPTTIELRVARGLLADLGIGDADAQRVVAVTGASLYLPWEDVGGCAEGAACDDLPALLPDPIRVDRDLDGRTDAIELARGTSTTDPDTDDDGILDGDEPLADTDGDGFEDARDCDADGDGVRDGIEAGLTPADVGPGSNPASVCYPMDADPTAATDPYAPDTDLGGLPDGVEDWNRNGAIGPWETDPNDPSDDVDTDGDGVADVLELLGPDGLVDDEDSDGDGIPDAVERLYDSDQDGVPAFLDDDSDGDGLPDAVEGAADPDQDGIPAFRDQDSDGDGLPDAFEGAEDPDGDGLPNFLDPDSDGDGLRDVYEGIGDIDQDGTPNFLDLDSDDDGLPDVDERERDADNDGIPNSWESDSDNDGIPDGVEGAGDADNDGLPNFEDRNADGVGSSDGVEGRGDIDCDGIPDYLDADDEDGFCDPSQPIPPMTGAPDIPAGPDGLPSGAGDWTGGCSTAGGRAGWLVLLGVLLVTRRAGAQQVDVERFRPSVDGAHLVRVQDLDRPEDPSLGAGIWVGRATAPLAFRPSSGGREVIVDRVGTASLGIAGGLPFGRLAVDVPLHAVDGLGVDGPVHLGDARVTGTVRAVTVGRARLGLLADLTLPTGDRDAWVSSGRARIHGAAVVDGRIGEVHVAGNAGVRSGTGRSLGALDVGPALTLAAGASWPADGEVSAALELDGEAMLGASGPGAWPLEWLGSARVSPSSGWTVLAGGGTALSRGVGAPITRVLLAVRWQGVARSFRTPGTTAGTPPGRGGASGRTTGPPPTGATRR